MEISSEPGASIGGRAWELMYEVWRSAKPYLETVSAAFDLTPQQVYAIKALSDNGQATMSAFASALGCDASNVTSIVDKLESRGLVERRASMHDRRVKVLVLTPAGIELRNRLAERMHTAPPAIANLDLADQESLCAVLQRALDSL